MSMYLHLSVSRRVVAVFCVFGVSLLAGCASKSQVSLPSQVNFAPPPARDPEPLVKGPQAIAATLAEGGVCDLHAPWSHPI